MQSRPHFWSRFVFRNMADRASSTSPRKGKGGRKGKKKRGHPCKPTEGKRVKTRCDIDATNKAEAGASKQRLVLRVKSDQAVTSTTLWGVDGKSPTEDAAWGNVDRFHLSSIRLHRRQPIQVASQNSNEIPWTTLPIPASIETESIKRQTFFSSQPWDRI